jgi:tetratricopeptide (TPR) repeat protein
MKATPPPTFPALTAVLTCTAVALFAQTPPPDRGGPGSELIRQGAQLDLAGKPTEARPIFQRAIDTAPNPAAKANAQRAMAMSWAFEGNCKKTAEYEGMVIDYWKTQEKEDPGRAFYQEGEMANEAARVCIDNGDLDTAAELYKRGFELGMKEPNIAAGRKDLWNYRWEHAQARIAARRGNKAEAEKHIAAARNVLEDLKQSDPKLYEQQASFLPYLTGYVALYTGNYKEALEDLQKANQKDAFIQCLIGMSYEKLGEKAKAFDAYRQAAAEARAHNPPAAFAIPFTRRKIAET